MMPRALLPCAGLCLCLAHPSVAEDPTFDVAGGEVRAIYRFEFSENTSVKCRLTDLEAVPDEQWGPSFSILLSETEDVFTRSDALRFVQLRLGIDADSGRHTYSLIVRLGGDSHSYDFFGTGGREPEAFSALGFRDEGIFGFRAREGEETFAQGHEVEAGIQPKYATVVASGLAGTVVCGIGSADWVIDET